MRKVEEIEEQIQKLSREEFAELRQWFLEQDWKAWDAQLEADVKAGKLDKARFGSQSGIPIRPSTGALRHYASSRFWALYEALLRARSRPSPHPSP